MTPKERELLVHLGKIAGDAICDLALEIEAEGEAVEGTVMPPDKPTEARDAEGLRSTGVSGRAVTGPGEPKQDSPGALHWGFGDCPLCFRPQHEGPCQSPNDGATIDGWPVTHVLDCGNEIGEVTVYCAGCAEKDKEIAGLREALAPFANRCAEKALGGKYSALTDSQWRRALETYQSCPGGDMCGCQPRSDSARKGEQLDA